MSTLDYPKRKTTNLPELSPKDAICCWSCHHKLDWVRDRLSRILEEDFNTDLFADPTAVPAPW